jgi:hypothetical protein
MWVRHHGPVVAVVAGSFAVLTGAVAAERQPRGTGVDPDQVLAEVPARGRDRAARLLDEWGRQLAAAPSDAVTAARVARLGLEGARRTADPRLLGRAQAALAPWWQDPAPPPDILLLRATIKQARHDFPGALGDVDRFLQGAPDDAQALLVRAVVLTVRGRYAEAQATCARVPGFVGLACAAPARAALGAPRAVVAGLTRALGTVGPGEAAWGHSLAGEIAYWAGDAAAERHLRAALALDPGDGYSRLVLADLLLDAGRTDEVRTLLAGREGDDASLLRLALAERQGGGPRAAALSEELGARHAAARRRGDETHAREEARYLLQLADDPRAALARALASWSVQHEPWDARLVLAAARDNVAKDNEAEIAGVAAFVAARGTAWRTARPEGQP